MVKKLKISKIYLTWGVLFLIFVVALLVVAPFVGAIISAYVLAFLLLPLFKIFNKKMGRGLSAILCILIVLILIIVPLFFIVNQIIHETTSLIQSANTTNVNWSGNFSGVSYERIRDEGVSYFTNFIENLIRALPGVFITLLVTFFGVFYFLYDWEKINSFIYRKTPLENKDKLFKDVSFTTKRITYGLLLVGALEFAISFVGFTISGVRFPLLLALIIGILAFTLVLDSSVVWGPVVLIYAFVFDDPGTAIGALITGLILSTDTILRPKIIGSVSQINAFVMLLGVLGGIALFGILGFIIGPIVLFFALRLFKESFEIDGD
ncbi:MAG: AI-2E family transporter [Candidatus Paceibacterota bacterium]|jgi:predicted PurR-regulated permease PerM